LTRLYLRQFCTIRTAQCLILIMSPFWIMHGIPYTVLYYHSIQFHLFDQVLKNN